MIKRLKLENFRNIQALEYRPAPDLNIVLGPHGSGKTNVLDAIAYADSNDEEFNAMLRHLYLDSKTTSLADLIRLNFFTHRANLDYFSILLEFRASGENNTDAPKDKKLEIWKTDEMLDASICGFSRKDSPYILGFESVDRSRYLDRAVSYFKYAQRYRMHVKGREYWPIQYSGPTKACSAEHLQKHVSRVMQNPDFQKVLKRFIKYFPDVSAVEIQKSVQPGTVMVRTKDRDGFVPLYGCPDPMVRTLSTVFLMYRTTTDYFLIDDLERGLTDHQLRWVVPTICDIAKERELQLFVSTAREDVVRMFDEEIKHNRIQTKVLDLHSEYQRVKGGCTVS